MEYKEGSIIRYTDLSICPLEFDSLVICPICGRVGKKRGVSGDIIYEHRIRYGDDKWQPIDYCHITERNVGILRLNGYDI